MKDLILNYIKSDNYQPLDARELGNALKIKDSKLWTQYLKTLNELEYEGFIGLNKKDKYQTAEKLGIIKGTLDLKKQGFGFLMRDSEPPMPDVFIPRSAIGDASHKDYCLARITKRSDGVRYEGVIIRVLKRSLEQIVGEYFQGAIFPKNMNEDYLFKVKPQNRSGLIDHSIVKAKIVRYSPNKIFDCQIIEVLGHATDPGIEILEVIASHDLVIDFPKAVKDEVSKLPITVLESDLKDRIDLRNDIIFTIDGDDTKDIDDAISIKKLPNQNYELGVHIADVSYYVREGTELDKEALKRGTSVYLADRVIPMLPRELSNGICSLNPNVDRLTISCIMEINPSGTIVNYQILPTVIHSFAQMTYKKVNKILDSDAALIQAYQPLVKSISLMNELAKILNQLRSQNGSINFETIEPKIIFDENGKVKDITIKERGVSEGIIEEFMLIANQTIAAHFDKVELPFIYRIHETPDKEKIEGLFTFARGIGYPIKMPKVLSQKHLQELLLKVEDTKFEKVINMMMLRSMAKAKYSEHNLGHYGLAFEDYTHFTSPIRRYPDTTVHRLIRTYLFEKKTDQRTLNHVASIMPDIASETSKAERKAMIAEREVLDMKKAEFMMGKEGEIFEGVISTLTRFGMFIELPNTVEGLVHISSFKEAMEFIEEKMTYLGIASRKEYTIGMVVKAKLLGVNPLKGQVDFELVE
ncbi:MAG: ribonuclease R [Tenericutes bacterium HGW-Tenericutes-1]|jgi:ribonuclease R|nr:MAG: ribonuclease R [Tenericutes bacterium HGW-Tenericutes-1]